MAFVPTPFATPVIAPNTYQAYRSASYLSASQYRFAPTAVATNGLVAGSNNQEIDSTASLTQVIARASSWIDDHCYHRGDGSFVASITVEQMVATVKPTGAISLITNFKPIREVVGLALGASSAGLQNIGPNQAGSVLVGEKTINLVGGYCSGYPTAWYGPWPSTNGQVVAVYSYIAGWPHTSLGANAAAGDTTITVNAPVAGADTLYGAYANTPLTIVDGARTEQVLLSSPPNGLTLSLATPLQYPHTVPVAPDFLPVTALPAAVQEAAIAVTNVLIKTQGMRAQVLPGSIGAPAPNQRQAMARAGALGDWEMANELLRPYVTTYLHA